MQEQETRQRTKRADDQVEETTSADTATTDQVVEDANCCLAEIDAALEEAVTELTDEQVYASGHPRWGRPYDSMSEFVDAHNRYAKAYEMLTGVVHQCGCGGCGSEVNGYDGDGRGGGFGR